MKKNSRLKNFPISFFSIIMGLTGFTISLQKGIEIIGLKKIFSIFFLFLASSIFVILTLIYLQKIIKYPKEIKKEFHHPVKINFFPTSSISLLLLSIAFLPSSLLISKNLWIAGTTLHLFFSLIIISIWIQNKNFKIEHMNPSWFIPAVGNMLVPISGVAHFSLEISWFFFSIGLFFWIILLVVFFYRIFFHEPLSEKLLPTLFILIAPPAIGFISYFKLTGTINDFSKILFNFALFITLLMFFQIQMFKKIKFYLSWWAYSFPLASMSIACALMYHKANLIFYKYTYLVLLLILSGLMLLLTYKTINCIMKKKICVEEA